jgi:phosphatidylglycerophosphate synthase
MLIKDYESVAHWSLTRRLAAIAARLTPNQISITGFVVGLAAAAAFSRGLYWAAAPLFLAHLVCDGLDGYVARLTGAASVSGFLLDHVLDRLSDVIIFVTIGVSLGLEREGFSVAILCLLSSYIGLMPKVIGEEKHNKSGLFAKTYRYQLLVIATAAAAFMPARDRWIFRAYLLAMVGLGLVTLITRGAALVRLTRTRK